MRERAKTARGQAAVCDLTAMSLRRQADQLQHEARLWAAYDKAEDALEALQPRTAELEEAVSGAVEAVQQAVDAAYNPVTSAPPASFWPASKPTG
jgi:hypothetical protein